jgi:hypothetical protein
MRIGLSLGFALLAGLTGHLAAQPPAPPAASAAAQVSNPEMKAMFDADQAARSNPAGIDWDVLAPQDEARRRRTRALLDAGRLLTADDFYRAAFVFQHGSAPADYLLAHVLATAAVARGHREAPWIAAATLDRYLQEIGQPQVFGTQFSGRPTTQEPYDRALFPDSLRAVFAVPDQAAQAERLRMFEERRRERERRAREGAQPRPTTAPAPAPPPR